jgi:aspartate/methionine/tyrosine aminotransferase
VLLADEVYQENVYQDERPFVSARKVGGLGGWGAEGLGVDGAVCICQ